MLSQEKDFLKQNWKKPHSAEISYITFCTSPLKYMAWKGISLICQWSRSNLCCWPTQGLGACPLGNSKCETLWARGKKQIWAHASQPEGTHERTVSCLSPGGTHCLQPLERQTTQRAALGAIKHPGLKWVMLLYHRPTLFKQRREVIFCSTSG